MAYPFFSVDSLYSACALEFVSGLEGIDDVGRSEGIVLVGVAVSAGMAERAFPVAPVDSSAAAAAGLQRLDTTDLEKAFSGKRSEQDARAKVYRAEYGSDGSVILSNSSGLIDRGTFSVTRQNGGGVCLRLEQQMNQRMCAIWFFAEDDVHLFGYNPGDGTLRGVS